MLKSAFSLAMLFGTLFVILSATGCGPYSLEPKTRPPGVPSDALWVGGADGGAYVRCAVDNIRDVDLCTVWNDNNGYSRGPGSYRLEQANRAATPSELKFIGAANDSIYLEGGLILKRQ